MSGPYVRPQHADNFNDGSATDETVIIAALSTGLELVEGYTAGALPNAAQARANMGLGSAATRAASAFDAAGAATAAQDAAIAASAQRASNLSDLANATTARANLSAAGVGYGLEIPDAQGLISPYRDPPVWQAPTDLVTQFESGHGWTGSAGFVANDTTDYITGVQSASITTAGTGSYKIESGTLALDLTQKQIRIRVKVDDITNLNYVNLWASNDAGYTNAYKWFIQGTAGGSNNITSGGTTAQSGWVLLILNVADAQITGSPTRTGITKLKFEIARTASAGEVILRVDEVDFVAEPVATFPNGAVVICFDDILGSSWSLAKPKLDQYRYRASHFVITDQVGQSGRVTLNQLLVMQDEGHEINSHAFTDSDHGLTYTGMTSSALDADLRAQKAWLRANGFRGDATAYPLGQYGLTTDSVPTHSIMRRYFWGARTTANGTNKPGATLPVGDPFRIGALSSITSFTGGFAPATLMSAAVGGLDSVKANHGVKVMTFHKIVASAPAALTEILQSDFNAIIDYIASLGMSVVTMGEYLAKAASVASGSVSLATPALTLGTANASGAVSTAIGSDSTIAAFDTTAPAALSATAAVVGSVAKAARRDHQHPRYHFDPADHGFLAWPYDPSAASSSTVLATAGTVYVVKCHLPVAANITNIVTQVTAAGTTLTSGQCFAGVYQGGVLLGSTADQSVAWASTGVKTMAISGGPVAAAAGDVYIAFFFNGTTGPTFPRGNGNALINAGLAAASSRYASADTGRTTTLAATLGALTSLSVSYWVAVS